MIIGYPKVMISVSQYLDVLKLNNVFLKIVKDINIILWYLKMKYLISEKIMYILKWIIDAHKSEICSKNALCVTKCSDQYFKMKQNLLLTIKIWETIRLEQLTTLFWLVSKVNLKIY